jgi:type II secretory pathway component PulF
MEICDRQFAAMNAKTKGMMALIDLVADYWWVAVAYFVLVAAAVAFLQVRGRPAWTYWLAAALFCVPCVAYWFPCAVIAGKLLPAAGGVSPVH